MANRRPIAGAIVRLHFNGIEVGWATEVTVQRNRTLVPVEVLGDSDVQQWVSSGRRVSMSASLVRIFEEGLAQMGITTDGDTIEDVEFPDMVAEVYHRTGDKPVFKVEGVQLESESWQVASRGIMTGNASMQGTRMYTEQSA